MILRAVGARTAEILQAATTHVWQYRIGYGVTWLLTLFVSVLIYPLDAEILAGVQRLGAGQEDLAMTLSRIGRFENSSLAFAVALALVGLAIRSERLRRAAGACLLAGIVAGLSVTVLRPALGRARPHAEAAPGFYWFETRSELHSMPSGHTASNFASAVAVAVVVPPLSVPALAYAGGVGWSRMQLNQHYPTDVMWGVVLGGSIGVAIGVVTRGKKAAPRSTTNGRS